MARKRRPRSGRRRYPRRAVAPIRVLVCDDVEAFRALMRYTLQEDPGIEVVGEAADGMAAIDAAERLQPDVVLLDLTMPILDGIDAIPVMLAARAGHAGRRPERLGGRPHGASARSSRAPSPTSRRPTTFRPSARRCARRGGLARPRTTSRTDVFPAQSQA